MIELIQGFKVGSTEPIDKRLIINNLDVESGADVDIMPEKYISVNTEDGLFYVYDRESNTFTKASDFIDKSDIQYYKRVKDSEGYPIPFNLDVPAEKDGDPETNIKHSSGGSFNNYKHESLDANDIVRRSGLTLAFYNNPAEEYQLYGALLDANNEEIAISNKIDIPLENAIKEIKLSEDKKKLIAIEISGQEHIIDFQEVYDAFHLVNQEDLANEKARAEAAELVLTNDLAAEVQRAKSIEGDLNNLTTSDKTNLVAAINSEEVRSKAAELKLTQDLVQEIQDRKDAINKEITDRTKAVSDEETRAKAAELKLNQDLAQETTRATTAESSLDRRLGVIEGPATVDGSIKKSLSDAKSYTDVESNRAKTKEGQIDSAISAEVQNRTNSDNTITSNLNNEIDRAKSAEGTLTTNLNKEINRASGSESILTTNINNEIQNRKDAINDVKSLVSAEETRSKGIESGLRTDLSSEITRAKGREDEIESKLNTEISRSKSAEGTLTTNLNTEIQNRIDSVNSEKTRALDAEKVNSDAIKSEKSSREAADSTLTTRIATEESTRANADTTLQTNISNEVTRATSSESSLSSRIDTEKSRIDTFYKSVQEGTSPTNKLTNEEFVADAITKAGATFRGTYNIVTDLELPIDSTKEQVIQKLSVKVVVKDENDYVFVEIPDSYEAGAVCRYDRYKYSAQAWSFEYTINNHSFTQSQWDAINSGATVLRFTTIESNISNEITRAKGAESTLTTNLNKEISDRESAISSEASARSAEILTEKTRAESVEAGLESNKANVVVLNNHTSNKNNPHAVSKSQVGLGNVDNTADLAKPISTATKTALDLKSDLSFVNTELDKKQNVIDDLSTIKSGAALGATSIQPAKLSEELNAYRKSAAQDEIDNSIKNRVSDIESRKDIWDSKQDAISDLSSIRSNASSGKAASDTIATYGNIVTHNVAEFATDSQGAKADTAVQPADINDMATKTWTNEQGFLKSGDISGKADKTYVDSELAKKQDIISAGNGIEINSEYNVSVILGDGLEFTSSKAIKVDTGVIQPKLTKGDNIDITDNKISATGLAKSSTGINIVSLTQAQYDALTTKDSNTLYVII